MTIQRTWMNSVGARANVAKGFVKTVLTGLATMTLLLGSLSANAILINVSPAAQSVNVGDSFSVDVIISELGAGAQPSIGAFDMDVLFDTSVLSLSDVVFGSGLDLLDMGSIQGVSGSGPVNIFELSLDPIVVLRNLQPDTFTMFTMTFDALAAGDSGIDLDVNDLSLATGRSIETFDVESGEVSVTAIPVPVPATLLLAGLGLAGIGFARRGRAGR